MSTDSIAAARITRENAPELADGWRAAGVQLMAELKTSLHSSRKALLALDLAGIEGQTHEQVDLIRRFDELMREGMRVQASERSAAEDAGSELSLAAPGWEEEVRHNANRIVEAARLQAALLTRAQHKLRVLANMLAGSSATYGPFRGCGQVLTADFCSLAGERI